MTEHDQALEEAAGRAGEQLRRAESDIAPEVAASLSAARRQAVIAAEKPAGLIAKYWSRVAGASVASSAIAATLLVTISLQNPLPSLPQMGEDELAAAQDAELLDDLEFVAWMIALEDSNELPNAG